jgi:hypothetical protein
MKMEVKAEAFRQQVEAKGAFQYGRLRDLRSLAWVAIQFHGTAILTAVFALFSAFGFGYGFGKDIAKLRLSLHVTTEPTPSDKCKWSLVQLPPTEASMPDPNARVLSHSSYDHPQAPELLGQWICGLMDIQSRHALSASCDTSEAVDSPWSIDV